MPYMSGFSRYGILFAGLGLAAYHSSEGDKERSRSTSAISAAIDCQANKFPPSDGWEIISKRNFDKTARVAAKAAAKAGGMGLAELKSKYCSYERRAENAVDRCFLFLRNPPAPGGDIKICLAPDGRVTDSFLGE